MTDAASDRTPRRSPAAHLAALPLPSVAVFVVALLALLVVNRAQLDAPPYWDAIVGYLTQSVWLAHHGLDLRALAAQPSFLEGGPNVFPFYAIAYLAAALLRVLSPQAVHTVLHLLNVACAALTVSCFFALLRRRMPSWLALLWCTAAAAEPIWSGQTAAIYLDLPAAMAMAVALWAVDRDRPAQVLAACALGFLLKTTLVLLVLAGATWAVLELLLSGRRPATPRRDLRWVAVFVPLLLVLKLVESLGAASGPEFKLWPERALAMARILYPSQAVLGLLLLLGLVALGLRWRRGSQLLQPDGALLRLLAIFVLGFWLSFHLFAAPLCRYTTMIIFPMFALAALLAGPLLGRLAPAPAAAFLLFSLLNQHGQLLPPLPEYIQRSGEVLERSREYLTELDANRQFFAELARRYREQHIVAPAPYNIMLLQPEMGYVTEPLPHVYSRYATTAWPGLQQLDAARDRQPATLYLTAQTSMACYLCESPQRSGQPVEIVLGQQVNGAPLLLYRHP